MVKESVFLVFTILLLLSGFFIKQLNLYPTIKTILDKNNVSSFGLQQIRDIPLSGGANRLDYQSIDNSTNRLYISHLGSNMVHVFDLRKQKVIKDIPLTSSPYGILAELSLKEVFVGIGSSNQVAVIDENTLQVTKYIQAGETPDGLAYDSQNKEVYVSNENGGTVSVINAKTTKHIADISVGGSVGNTHLYDKQNRIYTVSGDDNMLVEIDPTNNTVTKKYPLHGCVHPHGFYIDSHTLCFYCL